MEEKKGGREGEGVSVEGLMKWKSRREGGEQL